MGNLGDFLFNGLDTHQFTMFHSRPWINSYRTYSLWLYNSLLWLNDGPRHSTHGRVLSLGVAELKRKQPNSWNLVGLGLKITLIYSDLNGKQNIKDKMFIHFLNTQWLSNDISRYNSTQSICPATCWDVPVTGDIPTVWQGKLMMSHFAKLFPGRKVTSGLFHPIQVVFRWP